MSGAIKAASQEESKEGSPGDEPAIKGNKQLGDATAVKLSDIIPFETLGAGAQGTVRKAVHKPSKKIIALKEIPMQTNVQVQKSIILELRTLHDCDHDNVLRSYGAFVQDGTVKIALEFMDAGSLASI